MEAIPGNPNLTGIAATTLPQTPKLLWKYETGDHIESSAAIVDGVVYVGVGNGDLIAVDLATGKLQWKYSAETFIGESSPAVGTDAVYIGDLDGILHAVNIRDGKRLWTYKTDAEIKSSPILVNDLVLIGSYDTHLYAIETRQQLRWKHATEGMVHATPAVHGDVVLVAGCDEKLRAIRIADGSLVTRLWPARTPGHRLSWTAIACTSGPSATKSSRSSIFVRKRFCGDTRIVTGSFRFIPPRHSSTAG